jgi:hypothetical protein
MITRAAPGHDPAVVVDEACFTRYREPSRPTTSPQAHPVSGSHSIGVSQVRSRVTHPAPTPPGHRPGGLAGAVPAQVGCRPGPARPRTQPQPAAALPPTRATPALLMKNRLMTREKPPGVRKTCDRN